MSPYFIALKAPENRFLPAPKTADDRLRFYFIRVVLRGHQALRTV